MDRVENGITIFASFLFIVMALNSVERDMCACVRLLQKSNPLNPLTKWGEIKSNAILPFNCVRIN